VKTYRPEENTLPLGCLSPLLQMIPRQVRVKFAGN